MWRVKKSRDQVMAAPKDVGLELVDAHWCTLIDRCTLFEVGDLGWVADAPEVPSGHRL